jgi:nucleoside-diphosphate-sugar epimerase
MSKILITGAAGFIGSHLTELLVEKCLNVEAFVHYNSQNNWGWLEESYVKKDIRVITGDIRDYDSVFNAVKGTDVVFH